MFTMVLAGCSPKNLLPGFVEEEDDQQEEENHAQPSQEDADDAEGTYVFDNGSVVAGSDLSWPAGSMGDLPIIDGKITAVVNIDTYTAVTCSNMTKAQAESYLAKIKNLDTRARPGRMMRCSILAARKTATP